MYTTFSEDKVISIAGILDQAKFFAGLPKLLPSEDYILGIASFLPDERVGSWLQSLPPTAIPGKYNFRFLTKRNSETPWGGAYYVQATNHYLEQFTSMAQSVESPEILCSHVIAFSRTGPLFIFHDAFDGPDMLVSSRVPSAQVEAFCSALGVTSKEISNPVPPEGRKSGTGIPKSELDYEKEQAA